MIMRNMKKLIVAVSAFAVVFAALAAEKMIEATDRYAKQAIKVKVMSEGGWNAIRKCGDRVDFEVEFKEIPTNLAERVDFGKAKLVVDNFGSHVIAEKEVDFEHLNRFEEHYTSLEFSSFDDFRET